MSTPESVGVNLCFLTRCKVQYFESPSLINKGNNLPLTRQVPAKIPHSRSEFDFLR